MKNEQIDSKDMITFVNRILEKSNHFNTVIHVPVRYNGEFIEVKDFNEDDIPSINHEYNDIYTNEYQITIILQKYSLLSKRNTGYQMIKKYRVRYNGKLESDLSLEEFKELYASIIDKYKEIKDEKEQYYENTDLSIFNSIIK